MCAYKEEMHILAFNTENYTQNRKAAKTTSSILVKQKVDLPISFLSSISVTQD